MMLSGAMEFLLKNKHFNWSVTQVQKSEFIVCVQLNELPPEKHTLWDLISSKFQRLIFLLKEKNVSLIQ